MEMVNYVAREASRDKALNLNQYTNDDNFRAHYRYTAPEIEKQLQTIKRSPPTAIIAGIGTSGHIAGIAEYFKEKYGDKVEIVGVVPAPGKKIPGIRRLETRPKWINQVRIDETVEVTQKQATEMTIMIVQREGFLIGLSSGTVAGAYLYVRNEYSPGTYMLIFPDDIYKYIDIISNYLKDEDTRER